MTTGLVGSFAGACDDMYTAAVTGIASMGIAGEFAYEMLERWAQEASIFLSLTQSAK